MNSQSPSANPEPEETSLANGVSGSAGHGSGLATQAAAFSPPTFSPLYQQIKSLIMQRLQSGEWRPGELIPSEVELGSRFKVSQGTVRKAIDALAQDNLLVRRQGKGTFVATHHEDELQYRFLRLKPDDPHRQRASKKIIDFRRLRASAEVARALALKSGDSVICVKRLLIFDDQPVIAEEMWLPGSIFRALTADRLAQYVGPTYGLFESEFSTRMIRASEQIKAVAADAVSAELLGLEAGAPLLSVERISYTYGDRPVEMRRGLYSTLNHHYQNELS